MRALIVFVLVGVGCKKAQPRFEGPLRVEFGDCAADASWSSGPRPLSLATRTAKKPDKPPEEKKPDDPPPREPDKTASKDLNDPAAARKRAIEEARNAGILGQTALQQGGAFASLTGTGDVVTGDDIYGGLIGSEDSNGFGPGGGGTGWGTIGTGRCHKAPRGTSAEIWS